MRSTQQKMTDSTSDGSTGVTESTLSEKLEGFLTQLGGANFNLSRIMVALLTEGKVRVDFQDFTERIELISADDRLSFPQVMTLLDDFLTTKKSLEKSV